LTAWKIRGIVVKAD